MSSVLKNKIKSYLFDFFLIGAASISFGIGFYLGAERGKELYSPKNVFLEDLNYDNLADLVIQDKEGKIFLYLGREDGKFQEVTPVELLKDIEENIKDHEKEHDDPKHNEFSEDNLIGKLF